MKKTILAMLTMAIVISAVMLSCDPAPAPDNNGNTHTHDWGDWQSNATQHWKECTANDGAEYGRANHTGNTCTVCGYVADPFEGTWVATSNTITYKLVAANGSFTQYNDNVMSYKGTYTVSENTVTITWTHEYKNNEWVTYTDATTEDTGTISGNTFIALITFTKQAPNTPQQNRTGTVALDRGLGTITVQVMGMTTQAEWNDIANKVKDSINSGVEIDISEYGEQDVVEVYKELFDRKVTFIIELNPVGYTSYKITGDGKTAYIALDKIDTALRDLMMPLYQNQAVVDNVVVQPHQTTITQGTPNGLAFAGSVTIKSDDTYTPAAWDAVVANVVAALNRGYDKFTTVGGIDDALNKSYFEGALATSENAEIIISSSASKKIEVLSTDYTKMYLKASAINDTLDLQPAVTAMAERDGAYELANAAPPKRRAFLALAREKATHSASYDIVKGNLHFSPWPLPLLLCAHCQFC